jgi:small GTP-binding protein/PAS domain S-box-containing protein
VDEELKQITSLMDLYDQGLFIHIFGSFKSANLIFDIPSVNDRGGRELIMLSIVIDINSNINIDLSKELLKSFETEFKKIPVAYKAFQLGNQEKLEEIRNLFFTFYQTYPKESIIYDRKEAKILVFGLFKAGKTTIINLLKKNINPSVLPTTHIDISRISVKNLSLYVYDTPGQIKYKSLCEPYLKNQDGLIFVIDIADTENFDAAKEILHETALMPELEKIPLLILLNKIDLIKPNVEKLNKELEIKQLGDRILKTFPTCGLTGKNIDSAFEWFSEKISKGFFPAPQRELGIIFSRWNEKIGAEIIALHPNDFFEDPEIISIRCFSLSQYIFGGEDFKRNSVILPFTHLKVKAAIYFDYVKDEKVRGGRLPLSIMVFYNESIPRVIIDKFSLYIFERFEKIKDVYANKVKVLEELKEIHNNISRRIKSFEPTIQTARIAEMRYQGLFKTARDAILIIDRKSGIIVDANEQSEKLLQRPLEDIISLHANQLQLENNQNFGERILKQLELENLPPIEIGLINRQKKIITIEVNTSEIQMGGQNLIQCILRDITERKLAEKKLQLSEAKFHEAYDAVKLYKELFAHDIADVFNRIGLSVEVLTDLKKRDYSKDEFAEIVKRLITQNYEGNEIIKKAQILSEIEDSKKLIKPVEIKSILKEVIDSIYRDFQEKDVAIEINSTKDDYIVEANELLFDAYENILINAIKYNENAQIRIEVKISDEIQNNIIYVKMEFIDNTVETSEKKGKIGIENNEVIESNRRGMLLGLILVDHIINSFNGQVRVEDKKNGDSTQGSSFVVLIPVA